MKKYGFLFVFILSIFCFSAQFSLNLFCAEQNNKTLNGFSEISNLSLQSDSNLTSESYSKTIISETFSSPERVKVIMNSVYVYENADTNSNPIGKAYFKDIYNVLSVEGDFYKIEFNDVSGYILTAYAMDATILSPIINLDTNASLIKDSEVYRLIDNEYEAVEDIKLDAETRVKVLSGYDANKPYCYTSFSLNDEILTFYIPTENIVVDGISTRAIIAITLMVTCITIFLILYSFLRGKKVKSIKNFKI
ncbi:MAG: SH3 domain-containing protein [Clostridia bacterium]|mgnify:CR=1 FL=1|jgi:hypothetical protein|nr:SH3 domain-containing protein [Clostridia bacterium]MDD3232105.1 SH3 domain-containing protein [Clostridia bacterium]MDD3862572.1 SH3 domain-containing protein [Clostridia bacterium]MDD4408741.1 SH3 domain-containing protein [Clostridia bacterium]